MEALSEALSAIAGVIAFVGIIGFVVERLTEKFVKPLVARVTDAKWSDYVALILGLVISVGFQIDVLTPLAIAAGLHPLSPWFGLIVTGLGVSGGSNIWHDIYTNKVQVRG